MSLNPLSEDSTHTGIRPSDHKLSRPGALDEQTVRATDVYDHHSLTLSGGEPTSASGDMLSVGTLSDVDEDSDILDRFGRDRSVKKIVQEQTTSQLPVYDHGVHFVRSILALCFPKILNSLWNDEHSAIVVDFLRSAEHKLLFASITNSVANENTDNTDNIAVTSNRKREIGPKLCLDIAVPSLSQANTLVYIHKSDKSVFCLDDSNFSGRLLWAKLSAPYLASLFHLMSSFYAPIFMNDSSWPPSICHTFISKLHRFMAQLTEKYYAQTYGETVLYFPNEDLSSSVDHLVKNKNLISRIEITVIHWMQQIRELLNSISSTEHVNISTPLKEEQFWIDQCKNLASVKKQLDSRFVVKVCKLLEASSSSYLTRFTKLVVEVQQGWVETDSNCKFLSLLHEPCVALMAMRPKDMEDQLAHILMIIRVIWIHSPHYNSRERVTALIRRVSSMIIELCQRHIQLDDIFNGKCVASIGVLCECIDCCSKWKALYKTTARVHHEKSEHGWTLDVNVIFTELDTFIQRCKDLIDICFAQIYLNRQGDVKRIELPLFHGHRAHEISASLKHVECVFQQALDALRLKATAILNVRSIEWINVFRTFWQKMKATELAIINIMDWSFESVNTVESGVHMLACFRYYAHCPSIGRAYDTKIVQVYELFEDTLRAVQTEFVQRRVSVDLHHPYYAGQAYWVTGLITRVTNTMQILDRAAVWLPETGVADEACQHYRHLVANLNAFMQTTYDEFCAWLEPDLMQRLCVPVLCRSVQRAGCIDSNMDCYTWRVLHEILHWPRLGKALPSECYELQQRGADLRVCQQNMLSMCRLFNHIVLNLSTDERLLFKDRLIFLSRKLTPGFSSLHWVNKARVHAFIRDATANISGVQRLVDQYKRLNHTVFEKCTQMAQTLLVYLEPGRLFQFDEYQQVQSDYRKNVVATMHALQADIVAALKQLYTDFCEDSAEVQTQWLTYVCRLNTAIYDSIRHNVQKSLEAFSEIVNVATQSGLMPLINIHASLDNDQVEFTPSSRTLATWYCNYMHVLTAEFSDWSHLTSLLGTTLEDSAPKPLQLSLNADPDINRVQMCINNGMAVTSTHMQAYIDSWRVHADLWTLDRDHVLDEYMNASPTVEMFDYDIQRYGDLSDVIQLQESPVRCQFLMIDCLRLKSSAMMHCSQWQSDFCQMLLSLATDTNCRLQDYMSANTSQMSVTPATIAELQECMRLHSVMMAERADNAEVLPRLEQMFVVLNKYDIVYSASVSTNLKRTPVLWSEYSALLDHSADRYSHLCEQFKSELFNNVNDLRRAIGDLVDEFRRLGPFTNAWKVADANTCIEQYMSRCEELRSVENKISDGLRVFGADPPHIPEICTFRTELDDLVQVWSLVQQWQYCELAYSSQSVLQLDVVQLGLETSELLHKFESSHQVCESRGWEVVTQCVTAIRDFATVVSLLADLRNKALRPRHWLHIKQLLSRNFDQDEFILSDLFEWGMIHYSEDINLISSAATKEVALEKMLIKLDETWKSMRFEICVYKTNRGYKCNIPDDLFATLEENQVSLSTMKSSRFVAAFRDDVEWWERSLTVVCDVSEALAAVQRLWLYMENIFLVDDIKKQMPQETLEFETLTVEWASLLQSFIDDPSILVVTHRPDILKQLTSMLTRLEETQKRLEMYLESKRTLFPRFYFISNDDLLDILAQARNPHNVQRHLKKLFDNIDHLQFSKADPNKMEATAMVSGEGEEVQFIYHIGVDVAVEEWLNRLEKVMRLTLKTTLVKCLAALKKNLSRRDRWLRDWPGQLCITCSQIQWTADTSSSLAHGERRPLKLFRRKQLRMLHKFSDTIRTVALSPLQRCKLVALVTIEVHARDVIERLLKSGVNDVSAFDWQSQLRLYLDREHDGCMVRQTNTQFLYGYEYLGNSGRLVVTPLTDRCYMTLTSALHLHRGGSPKGPAGTGKTETVKDLGKALAMFVIVFNCSEALDYKSMAKMFSGLAQTGAWGCYDEFNRINLEVLSVVAQQILSILQALSARASTLLFDGHHIPIVSTFGIFITMNPGYAGRTELPDNLKYMFRPISMVVPDSTMIAEIVLFGEGFNNTKTLARKVYTLYQLATKQLSRQNHYDFGLRGLIGLLRYAGCKRRAFSHLSDEEVVITAMNDMNLPKLTSDDTPLFSGIVADLFPGLEAPLVRHDRLNSAIVEQLTKQQLQVTDYVVSKVTQLYETKSSRHSTMLVGATGTGKSTVWRTLQMALCAMCDWQEAGFQHVHEFVLNPKSLSLGEMYGEIDLTTGDWCDGVLSALIRSACADTSPDEKWIVLDGPVDALWIENMNSVMDDNKVLTLINSERIALPVQVSLLFEVENLDQASPATVSRAGMVYTDYKQVGWRPYAMSWLHVFPCKATSDQLRELFEAHLDRILHVCREGVYEPVAVSEINVVTALCRLLQCLCTPQNGVNPADAATFHTCVKYCFFFCVMWSVCAPMNEEGRKRMDLLFREMDTSFPNKDTVFEYYIDQRRKTWAHWSTQLPANYRYNASLPFYKIIVPTIDTVRYEFLLTHMIGARHSVMLSGAVGTGKTFLAHNILSQLSPEECIVLAVNMSAQTSSRDIQATVESRLEKRSKTVYVPQGGKRLLVLLDDISMPARDTYGSQPPLELVRHLMQYGFWYNRGKQTPVYIQDTQMVATMGPPGGGRSHISRRLQSKFYFLNVPFPDVTQLTRIYGTLVSQKLADFNDEVKMIGNTITQASIDMYQSVVANLLPTPSKIHYAFNLRDISKVFQGLSRCHRDYCETKISFLRLWYHESLRVYSDRLVDQTDSEWFSAMIAEKLGVYFEQTSTSICPNKQPLVFGNFLSATRVYDDIQDFTQLKEFMYRSMAEYNATPGALALHLVLFMEAVLHVTRVVRVLTLCRGHVMVVGLGGSGRHSLCRLAAHVSGLAVYDIEVHRNYDRAEFRDDLRVLYRTAGLDNKPIMFLFSDAQAIEDLFFEDINNILSSGEVPNLYKPEELEEIYTTLQPIAKSKDMLCTPENLYSLFLSRVNANLHVCICMSPIGLQFRNRIRMYPALVNCSNINWVGEWPQEALMEVAYKFLDGVNLYQGVVADLSKDELQTAVSSAFSALHHSVVEGSARMLVEVKRHNHVTFTSYFQLVAGYKQLLADKRLEVGNAAEKLRNGLHKIDETSARIEVMSVELEAAKQKVAEFTEQCEQCMVVIVQQTRDADEQQRSVQIRSKKIAEEEEQCKTMAEVALSELQEVLPILDEAVRALDALSKRDLNEIKSYSRPPNLVEMVMEAVMILKCVEPTWTEAKRQLGDANFITQLRDFDKDNISDRTLKRIGQYVVRPEFDPEQVGKQSLAARSLCLWVRAMESYGRVFRIVNPKKRRLESTQRILAEKQSNLAEATAKLDELSVKLQALQVEHKQKLKQKEELRVKAEGLELKLTRAAKIVEGLLSEKIRWTQKVTELDNSYGLLVGDCLIAAAFVCYLGPFSANYRLLLTETWQNEIQNRQIPVTENLSLTSFLADDKLISDWTSNGLPGNAYNIENAIIAARSSRFPLFIDPQGQGVKWIKRMEAENDMCVVDPLQSNYLKLLEIAVWRGKPVLLYNVQESLEASLTHLLTKSFIRHGENLYVKVGDKDIQYNPNFRLYISTKLSNPHFSPETSTKISIINFIVREDGLSQQLLGIVVRRERPELEERKQALVTSIASGKYRLVELEDQVLSLLKREGSLLDDEKLVDTLQSCKLTASDVTEQLQVSQETEAKIDHARQAYKPCSDRASVLFFVLIDMGQVDPMYQFSLDAYTALFVDSINRAQRSPKLDNRIQYVNEFHTYAVYKYACRGLFEKHKLLFCFHMCVKVYERVETVINLEEYQFFLRGGVVLDREQQLDNPCSAWLSSAGWDNISELERLPAFRGIVNSFETMQKDWHEWYTSEEPENCPLPGDWEMMCSDFQRMIFIRCLRADRVPVCVSAFIANHLGQRFTESSVLDFSSLLEDSSHRTPLIFILSSGVDPTSALTQFAEQNNMLSRFHCLSLGQGQAPIATRMLKRGKSEGHWVFLANCHLSLSWMPALDQMVEELQSATDVHPDFRLWLSSCPHPSFPVSILQSSIKTSIEAPAGVKANMKRLYQNKIEESQLTSDAHVNLVAYKRLLFSLCFFHCVLIERAKFQKLGWNVLYSFNDSDFEVSESLLSIYIDEYESPPWEALKYLIAGVMYGGHVTDDWDRRLLMTYISHMFCDAVLDTQYYMLSTLPEYYIPRDGSLGFYRSFVNSLPAHDHPEVFGQHANADIACSIGYARTLFETLLSLQPYAGRNTSNTTTEDQVIGLSDDVLNKLPKLIDFEGTKQLVSINSSPLNIVLLQEIQRYNHLLTIINTSLTELKKSIRGLAVMSPELENSFVCVLEGRVPPSWMKVYPSHKLLGAWTRDLGARVHQFSQWSSRAKQPPTFWLSAFTFPTGFLTAVLQTAARFLSVSVDTLSWEFIVLGNNDSVVPLNTQEGVYVHGLYLEGASWDVAGKRLVDASPMKLVDSMPVIHLRPREERKTRSRGMYSTPVYYYPDRCGTADYQSFVLAIDLNSGDHPSSHWTKRATALLLSLSE